MSFTGWIASRVESFISALLSIILFFGGIILFVVGEQMVSLLGCGAMIFGVVLSLYSEYKSQQVPVISSRPAQKVVYVQVPVQQQPPIQYQQSIVQTQQPTYGSSVPRPERFPKQPKW